MTELQQKLHNIITQLERWGSDARQQQKVSRDPKKQFFFLSKSNTVSETIGLLKRTFYKELTENTQVDLTTKPK